MGSVVNAFPVLYHQELRRFMTDLVFFADPVTQIPKSQQIQKVYFQISRKLVTLLADSVFDHRTDGAAGAVFENDLLLIR